ncbi:TetR/AcrR family transcriptional regulator [Fervidibacillus albus]|uniref:TetR/AcrR family transcriptional regulator n=1 Tax=Fervidibacillus albus TaxID=2980026 RepID=A0A9E8LXZ8_9BACI|nr:TetR/AcrR family transcriptional regulator [Fervidibacillus albus]WAA11375.1 TetR/AcrR family transcriptional regulator [Fervidibacillus albus]
MRREQMIKGAISLFKEKGYHRTTTREIAKASGFSIGTLYEYIRTKEDILYLVCDQIYDEVQEKIKKALHFRHVTKETIKEGLTAYFKIMDDLQDEVLVMYQELKSLPREMLPVVLKKELEMVAIFEDLLKRYFDQNQTNVCDEQIHLYAHNIIVQGQMWGFRRWALRKQYTLEQYTEWQFQQLIRGIDSLGK